MANTERLAALQKVRAAETAIDGALRGPLSDDEKSALVKLDAVLEQLEDSLIVDEIQEQVASIRESASMLTETVEAINRANSRIASTLSIVETAAKAVDALGQIVSIATAHGLLG